MRVPLPLYFLKSVSKFDFGVCLCKLTLTFSYEHKKIFRKIEYFTTYAGSRQINSDIPLNVLRIFLGFFPQESNRKHIENAFSGCVIKSKILTPHQTGQLVVFMMDHSQRMFQDPLELEVAMSIAMSKPSPPGTGKCVFSEISKSLHMFLVQGGHGTGKTGNLVLTFSRQGKHREFCCNTGKVFETQGKYF